MGKRKLRSEVGEGLNLQNLGPLSLLRGCGYSYEDLKKPRVAIINTWSEMNPGHIHLKDVAAEVKKGIYEAGGKGYEFNCVSVCDSVAEGPYVLPSRDLLVNEIELLVEGNKMDAIVLIGSCDKIIPGLVMAAGRLDLPSIVVTGGYMQTGSVEGKDCDFIDIGMTISEVNEGTMTEEQLAAVIENACPGPGACGMMGTANTMSILTEAMGMSFPGNSTIGAVSTNSTTDWEISSELKKNAYDAGVQVMKLWEDGITSRQIITNESISNAIKVCMAVGGSSNTIIHIPAIATESELTIDCSSAYAKASNEIPLIVGVRPNVSMHTMKEFDMAGGLGPVLNELKEELDLNTMSVTGKTLKENMALNSDMYTVKDDTVIHPISKPLADGGGLVLCKGNLVPEGAFIKRSAAPTDMVKFSGPAMVFNDTDTAVKALKNKEISEGDVIVIRYQGVKAGPGTAYSFAAALKGSHLKDKVVLITDGRTSGAAAGATFQYASPEAALKGPLCAVKDGDIISYDLDKGELNIDLTDEELNERIETADILLDHKKGYLGIYQRCVGSVLKGAVLRG